MYLVWIWRTLNKYKYSYKYDLGNPKKFGIQNKILQDTGMTSQKPTKLGSLGKTGVNGIPNNEELYVLHFSLNIILWLNKVDKMNEACGMHVREEKCIKSITGKTQRNETNSKT